MRIYDWLNQLEDNLVEESNMKLFEIIRISYIDDGTFGVIKYNNVPIAVTLEPEWKDNRKYVSCIPAGWYRAQKYSSEKFPESYHILDVPKRYKILIHPGNIEEHTQGCILIGEKFDYLKGKTAILESRKGFNEFLDIANGDEYIQVHILDPLSNLTG